MSHIVGYSRKSEVLFESRNFDAALPLIQKCFTLSPDRSDKDYYMDWCESGNPIFALIKSLSHFGPGDTLVSANNFRASESACSVTYFETDKVIVITTRELPVSVFLVNL